MPEESPHREKIPVERLGEVINLVAALPGRWILVVVLAAVLSLFEISSGTDGKFTFSFRFTAITAGLVALVWLPALLKIVALTGGGVKTSFGEATSPGLGGLLPLLTALDPDTKRETLPHVIAALQVGKAELLGEAKAESAKIQRNLESQLAALPLDAQQARLELDQLARAYEQVRTSMPAGNERTVRMASIAVSMAALAKKTKYSPEEVIQRFQKGTDGDRLAAIQQVQGNPNPGCFQIILDAIRNPRSPFEQYRALLVAQAMLPQINEQQKQVLRDSLQYQRSGAEGAIINSQDPTRFSLSGQILAELGRG
jgi:hypothetical protein